MQSRTSRDFLKKIRVALVYQQLASKSFGKPGSEIRAKYLRSRAIEAFLDYWLSKSSSKKNRLLERSWDLARKSLRSFESSKHFPEYAETFENFSRCVGLSIENDCRHKSRIRKLKEAIEAGKKALHVVKSTGNKKKTAKIQARVSGFLEALADDSPDPTKSREYQREALDLYEESLRTSREASLQEISHPLPGFHKILDPNVNRKLCEEALTIVRPQRDNFAVGRLLDHLAKWTCYAAAHSESGENPAIARRLRFQSLRYAENAARHYDIINFTSPIAGVMWVHSPYAEHFQDLANLENDRARRQLILEKALNCTLELLQLAKRRGSPDVMSYALHTTYRSEAFLAVNETDRLRKKGLLRDALSHSVQAHLLLEQVTPIGSFNRAIALRDVVSSRLKLAELEEDPQVQARLLHESIEDLEECLKLVASYVRTLDLSEPQPFPDLIGLFHRTYGDTLLRLVALTKNHEYLRKASHEYTVAAECYESIPRYDRSAECYWRLGEAYDLLQASSLASRNFMLASKFYAKLGRRAPALKQHCKDYARYLMAWGRIEEARTYHTKGRYGRSSESYNSAAGLLKSANKWSFLALYFSAWSRLEAGEDLSKRGLRQSAIESFQKATTSFSRSRDRLKENLTMLYQPDERKMAEKLVASPSIEYAQARVALEEAVEAESQEDYTSSVERFVFASKKLREASDRSESEQDSKETDFLSTLCEAWQLSVKAESENSTKRLEEACRLLEKARDMSPNQTSRNLALGHVAFCKGMIAGRKFAENLDLALYKEASRQLDISSGYYLNSGFRTASEHSRGRKLLVDALSQIHEATMEREQQNRAVHFRLAGALLKESAEALRRARQPRKREQVFALLGKAKEESKIASDLTEILHTTLDGSTNVAFSKLAKGDEKAAGLDRFTNGDVEVRLAKANMNSEGNIEVEIEITNTGSQPIRLIRLDGILPDGTELKASPEGWALEGTSLKATQKRLKNLQTEVVRMAILSGSEELLNIQPKAVFVDNSGIQSERTTEPKIVATSPILDFLAKAFVEDFTSKRLTLPASGWRTLMETVRDLKIPRSHVYGEPRYGRPFGRQLESLLKSSLVEYRIFPRERGRGGNITRLRVLLTNEDVRNYIDNLVPARRSAIDRTTLLTQAPQLYVDSSVKS